MSDIELHSSLYLVNTEQAVWGVSQNYTRYISRSLASLPKVQLRSCTITFAGEADKVSISFNYYLSSNLQFLKIISVTKLTKRLMFMTFDIS